MALVLFHHHHVSSSLRRLTAMVLHPSLFSAALLIFSYESIFVQSIIFFIHVSLGFPLDFFPHTFPPPKQGAFFHLNPLTHVQHTLIFSFSYPFWNAILFEFYRELHHFLFYPSNLSSKFFCNTIVQRHLFFQSCLIPSPTLTSIVQYWE